MIHPLIETRGEGGYVVIAPTVMDGRTWVRVAGGYGTVATITANERRALLELARTFDQEAPRKAAEPVTDLDSITTGTRPGDDYAARTTWPEILEPHGWVKDHLAGDGNLHWTRPGKDAGTSATINEDGEGVLYIFSSSTAFESNQSYGKFAAYTILNHEGDYSAAAAELRRQGYGKQAAEEPDRGLDGEPDTDDDWISAADVVPEPIEWLWPGYVPRGGYTIMDGDGGVGKTQFACDLTARISTGGPRPNGDGNFEQGDVLFVANEDHFESVLVPRLIANGAELARVHLMSVGAKPWDITQVERMERAIDRFSARFIYIDGLFDYVPRGCDINQSADATRAMRGYKGMLKVRRLTSLITRHVGKSDQASAGNKGLGSVAWRNMARQGLILTQIHDKGGKYTAIAVHKINLGPDSPTLTFRFEEVKIVDGIDTVAIRWGEPSLLTAAMLAAGSGTTKPDQCAFVIVQYLEEIGAFVLGKVEAEPVIEHCRGHQFALSTIHAARKKLRIESKKVDFSGGWYWFMP